MNRIERLTAIVLQLQQKKVVTARELSNHFGISVRTIYRDMKSLEEAGIPLGAEAGEGYQLLDGFHLPPIMFTEAEAGALVIGAKFAENNTDSKVRRHIETALMKIYAVLPESNKVRVDLLKNSIAVTDQTANNDDAPSELLTVQNAIINRNCLLITYHAGSSNEMTSRIIEPLGLIHYADNWHLIAFCRLRKDYRDFRLDRINSLSVRDEQFSHQEHFSIRDFLENQEDGIHSEEFQVIFPFAFFRNISRRNLFGLTTIMKEGEFIRATFIVPNMSHMVRWLISLGENVTVIYPDNLKNMMMQEVSRINTFIHEAYQ